MHAALGASLLVGGGAALAPAARTPPGRATDAFARVLGARHLLQAALLGGGGPVALRAGACIDTIHAGTAAFWALHHPRRRRLLVLNAIVATALAVDGGKASRDAR